jgi:hypothetical protein
MDSFKLIATRILNCFGLSIRIGILVFVVLMLLNFMHNAKDQAQHYADVSEVQPAYKVWCLEPSCFIPASIKELIRIDRLWK